MITDAQLNNRRIQDKRIAERHIGRNYNELDAVTQEAIHRARHAKYVWIDSMGRIIRERRK